MHIEPDSQVRVYELTNYYQDIKVCTKTEQNHGGGIFAIKLIYFEYIVYTV